MEPFEAATHSVRFEAEEDRLRIPSEDRSAETPLDQDQDKEKEPTTKCKYCRDHVPLSESSAYCLEDQRTIDSWTQHYKNGTLRSIVEEMRTEMLHHGTGRGLKRDTFDFDRFKKECEASAETQCYWQASSSGHLNS